MPDKDTGGGNPPAQPQAILAYIPALSIQQIEAETARLALAHEMAELHYADHRNAMRKASPHITTTDIENMERRGWIGNVALQRIYGDWLNLRQAQAALDLHLQHMPTPRPASVRILVSNAHHLRDQLRADGYTFDPDAIWADPAGLKTSPGWTKTVSLAEARQAVDALRAAGIQKISA